MPEFLIFVIAASMCVLCFAAGFVAALVLRIAGFGAVPGHIASPASETPTPAEAESLSPTVVEAATAPVVLPVPQTPAAPEQAPTAVSRNAPPLPVRPAAHAARAGGFPSPAPTAPTAPPAKVFLFGDPQVEAVAAPSFAPVHGGSHPTSQAPKPHVAPLRFGPAEIDLLPHRPQHARSGRGR
jgi:hypothetical protein